MEHVSIAKTGVGADEEQLPHLLQLLTVADRLDEYAHATCSTIIFHFITLSSLILLNLQPTTHRSYQYFCHGVLGLNYWSANDKAPKYSHPTPSCTLRPPCPLVFTSIYMAPAFAHCNITLRFVEINVTKVITSFAFIHVSFICALPYMHFPQ